MAEEADQNLETIIKTCAKALDDKKAEDLKVLYLGEKSSVADYFVLATGTSDPHLKALSGTLEAVLKDLNIDVLGSDKNAKNGWQVVDAYDVIFHFFTSEMRERYNLEGLWKDAELVAI